MDYGFSAEVDPEACVAGAGATALCNAVLAAVSAAVLVSIACERLSTSLSGSTQIKLGPVANARTTVIASFDLDHLDIAGPYIATVEFAAPPEPPPAVPKGGSDASATTTPSPEQKDREQTVQLKLNKPAAELRVSTPLQIERTVWLPCLSFLEPDTASFTCVSASNLGERAGSRKLDRAISGFSA